MTLKTETGLIRFQVVGRHFMAIARRRDFAAIQMARKATLLKRSVREFLLQRHRNRVVACDTYVVRCIHSRLCGRERCAYSRKDQGEDCPPTQIHRSFKSLLSLLGWHVPGLYFKGSFWILYMRLLFGSLSSTIAAHSADFALLPFFHHTQANPAATSVLA
jgi:hypothetical protein